MNNTDDKQFSYNYNNKVASISVNYGEILCIYI